MRQLHWHTAENPCLMFGEPVTPERWNGGITDGWSDRQGRSGWFEQRDYQDDGCRCGDCQGIRAGCPIFPPAGWAGKTDAELWTEIVGEGWLEIGLWRLKLHADGSLWQGIRSSGGITLLEPEEARALLSDGANAQVLAARLKEAQR